MTSRVGRLEQFDRDLRARAAFARGRKGDAQGSDLFAVGIAIDPEPRRGDPGLRNEPALIYLRLHYHAECPGERR